MDKEAVVPPPLDSLPKPFVSAMRTLFNILDEKQTGLVSLKDIEKRWCADATSDDHQQARLPKGVIEALRKVTAPNGQLDFQRFCGGLKMALLRDTVAEKPEDKPADVVPNSSVQVDKTADEYKEKLSVKTEQDKPEKPPRKSKEQQNVPNVDDLKKRSPIYDDPGPLLLPEPSQPSLPNGAPVAFQLQMRQRSFSNPKPLNNSTSNIHNKNPNTATVRPTNIVPQVPGLPNKNVLQIQGHPSKNVLQVKGQLSKNALQAQENQNKSVPHVPEHQNKSVPQVPEHQNKNILPAQGPTNKTAPSVPTSQSQLIDYSANETKRKPIYEKFIENNAPSEVNGSNIKDTMAPKFHNPSDEDVNEKLFSSFMSEQMPRTDVLNNQPIYGVNNQPIYGMSRSNIVSVLKSWQHEKMVEAYQQSSSSSSNGTPATSGTDSSNESSHAGSLEGVNSTIKVDKNHNDEAATNGRRNKRTDSRRHTLSDGIDYNMIKRMKQLGREKMILIQGLDMLERAREWYHQQLLSVQERQKQMSNNNSLENSMSETYQECLNFQMSRILEVNQHLSALMQSTNKDFPQHMNLALRQLQPKVISNQENNYSPKTERVVTRLKEQNTLLTREMTEKNEKIVKLEREKSELLRQLFESRDRGRHAPASNDSTFM